MKKQKGKKKVMNAGVRPRRPKPGFPLGLGPVKKAALGVALLAFMATPLAVKNTPYILQKIAAIDGDGQRDAEHKEGPNKPHPPKRVVEQKTEHPCFPFCEDMAKDGHYYHSIAAYTAKTE